MTRYNELQNKVNLLISAANICCTRGRVAMATVWLKKANELLEYMGNLTIAEAVDVSRG